MMAQNTSTIYLQRFFFNMLDNVHSKLQIYFDTILFTLDKFPILI